MKSMVAPTLAVFLSVTFAGQVQASWMDGIGNFFRGSGNSDDKAAQQAEETAADPATAKESFTEQAVPAQASSEPVRRPAAASAANTLVGSWELSGVSNGKSLGSLSADKTYFTIKLSEPAMDMRIAYTQAPNGDFTCTVLDKQVIILEGRFRDADRFDMSVKVKDIGKPEVRTFEVTAKRSR